MSKLHPISRLGIVFDFDFFVFRRDPSIKYYNFDVPHEEQDIITEEDRLAAIPKTIQEVLKDVVVYVEVRYGVDNRTAGVKNVISRMGAKVNDRLLK